MRSFILIVIVSLVTSSALAAENWPPRAEDGIVADVYPSHDLALRAVKAKLGDDAKILEADGKIIATAKADASRELTVSFVDKPWAADWTAFRNRTSENLVRAQSTSPSTSEGEADSAARNAAIAALMPVVRERMTTGMGAAPTISDKSIRGVIEANLQQRQMIRDRFVQRYSRSYGDVWHEVLLLDTSPSHIDSMVWQVNSLEHHAVQRQIGLIMAFLLLLFLISVGYALINWLTKGYFVWRLRFAAMTMITIAAITAISLS
jgi:hypothetical protein